MRRYPNDIDSEKDERAGLFGIALELGIMREISLDIAPLFHISRNGPAKYYWRIKKFHPEDSIITRRERRSPLLIS